MGGIGTHLWFARVYFVVSAGIAVAGAWCGHWVSLLLGLFSMFGAISIGYLVVMLEQQTTMNLTLAANLENCWRRIFLDEFSGLSGIEGSSQK